MYIYIYENKEHIFDETKNEKKKQRKQIAPKRCSKACIQNPFVCAEIRKCFHRWARKTHTHCNKTSFMIMIISLLYSLELDSPIRTENIFSSGSVL